MYTNVNPTCFYYLKTIQVFSYLEKYIHYKLRPQNHCTNHVIGLYFQLPLRKKKTWMESIRVVVKLGNLQLFMNCLISTGYKMVTSAKRLKTLLTLCYWIPTPTAQIRRINRIKINTSYHNYFNNCRTDKKSKRVGPFKYSRALSWSPEDFWKEITELALTGERLISSHGCQMAVTTRLVFPTILFFKNNNSMVHSNQSRNRFFGREKWILFG